MDAVLNETTTSAPLLEIRNLSISYFTRAGEVPAVRDFSLTLHPGEGIGLVGESGCGKSTVAMAIMQYLGGNGRIVKGEILFKGRDLVGLDAAGLRRLRGGEIAMVYQEPMAALNPSMTIGKQLAEVPIHHDGASRAEALRRARDVLADVGLPDPDRILAAYPHQISGGQQQRAIIAMALLSRPALLLLDEPTTALDVTIEAGIVDLIRGISEKTGTSLLYISHNLGLILETCSRVNVMYSGEVVEEGSVAEVFENPRHPYTRGLFQCIPLPGTDKTTRPLKPIRGQLPLPQERPPGCNFGPRCDHFTAGACDGGGIPLEADGNGGARTRSVRCVRWRDVDSAAAPQEPPRAPARAPASPREDPAEEVVLTVDNMRKYYAVHDRSLGALFSRSGTRYVKANEALTFSVRRRETLAIVGESGCGKSTFAKVVMGLETASEGSVRFNGEDLGMRPVQRRTRKQLASLQMIFQDPDDTLNPSHSIGRQIARVVRRFGTEPDAHSVRERVGKLLDLVKLPRDIANQKPRQLSGGQKQRIGIARAFAGNPAMVVADEPLSALDVSVQAAVTELLMDIQREHGTTLLFISHDLGVVRYLADRVVVMYLGRIMETGTTDEVYNPPYHPYTEALLSAAPIADPRYKKKRIVLEGSPPSVLDPPLGCPFHTRCPRKIGAICEQERPAEHVTEAGHRIACHIPLEELKETDPVIQVAE